MATCTKCDGEIADEENVLPGTSVYGEMAGGNDRDDLLETYSGIRYKGSVLCAECLDTPTECRTCGGTGKVQTDRVRADGGATTETEPCPECDGAGQTKPDLLRSCCK